MYIIKFLLPETPQIDNNTSYGVPIAIQSEHFNHVELAFITQPNSNGPRRNIMGIYVTICLPTARMLCTRRYVTGYKIEAWYVIDLTNEMRSWLSNQDNVFNRGNTTASVTISISNLNVETSVLVFRVLESRVHSYPFIGRVKRSPIVSPPEQPIRRSAEDRPGECRLFSWYVTFAELQMNDYVANPSGATVNYCAGNCMIHPGGGNITSHAYVSAIYRKRQDDSSPDDMQQPYCVPSKLASINVVFRQTLGYRVMTVHGMGAEQCTCV